MSASHARSFVFGRTSHIALGTELLLLRPLDAAAQWRDQAASLWSLHLLWRYRQPASALNCLPVALDLEQLSSAHLLAHTDRKSTRPHLDRFLHYPTAFPSLTRVCLSLGIDFQIICFQIWLHSLL